MLARPRSEIKTVHRPSSCENRRQIRRAASPQDAFISYSHAADGELAPAIESALERLAKPWYRRRSLSVFRDATGLSVNPHLWTSIAAELDASRKFILLASPSAAASEWVGRELEYWLEKKSADDILIVLTEGTLTWDEEANDFARQRSNALPPVLFGVFTEEPLYLDLSWAHTEGQLDVRHPRFREEIAKLAAAIVGTTPDELIGEDIRLHRQALRLAWSAGAALAVLLLVAVAFAAYALDRRHEALLQRDAAQSRALAAQSLLQLSSDPELSALIGIEAALTSPTRQAVTALRRAIDESAVRHRFAFGSPVVDVAFASPDGVVGGGRDGRIARFEIESGEKSWSYNPSARQAGSGGLVDLVRLNGGRQLLAVLGRAVVRLDAETGNELWSLPVKADLWADALSRDGRTLALAFETHQRGKRAWYVALLDIRTGAVSKTAWGPSFFPHAVTALAFHPREDVLAMARGARVDVVDATSGDVLEKGILEQAHEIAGLAFSPSGALLASAGSDGALRIWSTAREREVREIRVPGRGLEGLAFSPSEPRLATAGLDGVVRTWDVDESRIVLFGDFDTGEELRTFRGHEALVAGLAYSADGAYVATAGADGTVRVWETRPESQRLEIAPSGYAPDALAFAPSADLLAIATDSGIEVRDPTSGAEVSNVEIKGGSDRDWGGPEAIAFHPRDRRLMAAVTAETLQLIRLPRTRGGHASVMRTVKLGSSLGGDVAFSPDGGWLGFLDDGEAKVWRLADGARPVGEPLPLRGHAQVAAIAFGPNGRVATASWDGTAKIWRAGTAEKPQTVGAPSAIRLFDVALSPDGALLATGGLDGAVRLWRTDTGEEFRTLRGHQGAVQGVAFAPDGTLLASAGSDRTVRIWEVPSGNPLRALHGHADVVQAVAFDRVGSRLASAGFDGRVRIWDPCPACFDAPALVELARSRVTRPLERAERDTFVVDR